VSAIAIEAAPTVKAAAKNNPTDALRISPP